MVVDNNTNSPAPYSNINTALAAANSGDTIYVQPSATSYGRITINKRLFVIGGGAYPLKQNTTPTVVESIQLDKGSSGSFIMGFHISGHTTSFYGIKTSTDSLTNILISNCYIIRGIQTGKGINAWIVEGCVFDKYSYSIDIISCANVLIQNNIFGNSGGGGNDGAINFQTGSISNVTIKNNIWPSKGGSNALNAYTSISALIIENNIFYNINFDFSRFSGCQWHNNCFYLTNTWIGNTGSNSGNFQGNPQFVNYPALGDYFSFNYDYHLASGSPCIGTGTNGTDVGVYGGAKRFNPGIMPPVPQIMQINLKNSTVPVGGTLKFDVIIEQPK